jgi:hypothetical protein
MSYQINYFAWNNTDGHDKVWGYVTVGADESGYGGQLYNFWGRRGGKLSFKEYGEANTHHQSMWSRSRYVFESAGTSALRTLQQQKEAKGYSPVAIPHIEAICGEGYIESFEKQLTLAKLFENFRGKRLEDS